MRCRRCEADNPQSARFCDSCGAELDRACGACGASNRAGARFCARCGSRYDAAERPAVAPASIPGYLDGEGERKLVTVLFADLRGSTAMIRDLDPEQAIGRLDPGVKAMAAAVEACGGVVNRVQGDGIMALFGAPIAREDHAIRACLAAHRMLAAIAALEVPDLEVRVGVNSGEVVIRATGSDATNYDAVGITVSRRNRLEQSARPAPRASRRSPRGWRAASPRPAARGAGVPGPRHAVEVFDCSMPPNARPGGARRRRLARSFVGRQAEIAMLTAALGRAGLGRGQAVLVGGRCRGRQVAPGPRIPARGAERQLRRAARCRVLARARQPVPDRGDLLRSCNRAEAADSGATISAGCGRRWC